jgi:ornithine carbamoyltransferase
MTEVMGIRDDMYIGKGHAYMKEVAGYLEEGFRDGVLEQRPTIVNLQCDIDHPTQTMADTLHLVRTFGGAENLKGKKIAMTWAYSPSYGKPLSVPQGVIGLMTRFGMDVTLAHPKGYEVMPDVMKIAGQNAGD